jgi:hemolysin-activating ACP:hemolysin acyltransferase
MEPGEGVLTTNKGASTPAAKDGARGQPSRRPDVERAAGADAATAKTSQPQTPTGEVPEQIPPDMRAKIVELRNRVRLNLGQVVLIMMNLPRYRHQALADLTHLVLDPMMRDRLAIARRGVEGQGEEDVAGIAIWLANEDWASGDKVWLLDVIAGDRKAATAVLANFRQLSGERDVKIHPIVARLVDKEILGKMKARAVGAAADNGQGNAGAEMKGH